MSNNLVRFPDAREYYAARLVAVGISANVLAAKLYPNAKNPAGSASYWLKGYGQPNHDVKQQVANHLHISLEDIEALYGVPYKNRNKSLVKQVAAMAPIEKTSVPTTVISVTTLSNGRTRIKLDIELSTKEGLALVQTLYPMLGELNE